MNELLKTELLILLSDASQEVTNVEMQSAYGNFVEHVSPLPKTTWPKPNWNH
jgi:hypothetical protein